MPSFPKPNFSFAYHTAVEIQRLKDYRDSEPGRRIPAKSNSKLLIGTWNIANLGQQQRRSKDYEVIGPIGLGWSLVAMSQMYGTG